MSKEEINECAEAIMGAVEDTIADTIDFYLESTWTVTKEPLTATNEEQEEIYKILITKLKNEL
tara:strand:- start:714 stop:902 length:189 start_codon:yes stop_codon:yes gene_type:complete